MFRNEHGRSFLNDAIRGGRETAGINSSHESTYPDASVGVLTPPHE